MAGSANFTVVLDACVFYPANVRDLLIRCALHGLFHAKWSNMIHDEWIKNLRLNRPDIDENKLRATQHLMNQHILDAQVHDFEYLIDALNLPDPNDRHVLAAAIVGQADAIVTFNTKDFPHQNLAAHAIEVVHPDDFLLSLYDLYPIKILTIVQTIRSRLNNPTISADELLAKYEQVGLTGFAKVLQEAVGLI